MRTRVIVLSEPLLDDHTSLVDAGEPLRVEHLAAERAVETLVIPILPGTSRLNKQCSNFLSKLWCIDSSVYSPTVHVHEVSSLFSRNRHLAYSYRSKLSKLHTGTLTL